MVDFIKYLLDKFCEPDLFFKWRTKVYKDNIDNSASICNKFAKNEYEMQFIMHVTQCRNREMAKSLFELTKNSDYLVAPNAFKRLYPYLTVENRILKKDEATQEQLNSDNKANVLLSILTGIFSVGCLFYFIFMNRSLELISVAFVFFSFLYSLELQKYGITNGAALKKQ